jgi:hypothetical protein
MRRLQGRQVGWHFFKMLFTTHYSYLMSATPCMEWIRNGLCRALAKQVMCLCSPSAVAAQHWTLFFIHLYAT